MAMPIMDGPSTIAAIKRLDPSVKIVCSAATMRILIWLRRERSA